MTEHRARNDCRLAVESADELVHILLWIEAQTMHTSIELDVYGEARDTLFLGCLHEGVEQTETVDFGFEVVVEHGLEGGHLGVHHHDVRRDAIAT